MINQEIKTIKQYLRGNIKEWMNFSIKICNAKCIISGQPFEVIHHKYPFHKIIEETFKELNLEYQEDINLYSDEDLELIKEKCLEIHYKYGSGACLTTEIHRELHHIFGNNITIEHFDKYMYYKQNKLNIDELENIFGKKVKEKSKTQIEKTEEEIKLNSIKERQKQELLDNLEFIKSKDFQRELPLTYKNIKRNLRCLEELILIAYENIDTSSYYDKDENIIFFTANRYMCNRLGMSENSSNEISSKIALLTYHKLINKLDETEIPKNIIKQSQIHNNYRKGSKHIGCYSIPSYKTLLNDIEIQSNHWINNNYSMSAISYEMFYRMEGLEKAQEIYPQHKKYLNNDTQMLENRTVTADNQKVTNAIKDTILNELKTNHYVTFKIIVNLLSHKYNSNKIENQYDKSIKEIMDSYGLNKIKCNKKIKEQYKVSESGYPYIIIRNEE